MLPSNSKYKLYEKTVPPGKNVLIHEHMSPYQLIRLYRNGKDYWMSLNAEMQFHTKECDLSHKYMCLSPLRMLGHKPNKILVIGGGDGLPTKLLLKHALSFTQIELDPDLVALTKTHPVMRKISNDSFNHPKVDLRVGDGVQFLIDTPDKYDIIIDDCDFGVSNQPGLNAPGKDDQKKYDDYKDAVIEKLTPGGIAVFMENVIWPWRNIGRKGTGFIQQWCIDNARQWSQGSQQERHQCLKKSIKDDIMDWKEYTPHVKSEMVILPVIGPEHYIYLSNRPLKNVQQSRKENK
jgi:spermidine synthase